MALLNAPNRTMSGFRFIPPARIRSTNGATISRIDDRRNSLIPRFLKKEGVVRLCVVTILMSNNRLAFIYSQS